MEPATAHQARSTTEQAAVPETQGDTQRGAPAPIPPETRVELPSAAPDAPVVDGAPTVAYPAEEAPHESELRFWLRPLVLSVLVVVLLGLTWWDSRRVPDRPLPPTVQTATPPAGATVSASDPALQDTLVRLRLAMSRRDAKALANLADPDGVVVAAYGGGLPESGYNESDAQRLAQSVLPGASLSILGWRTDPRDRVIVLTDGWQTRPLRLAANSTLELTSLTAIGLTTRNGLWYWRWLLPDSTGVLAQQARSSVWQPFDVRG